MNKQDHLNKATEAALKAAGCDEAARRAYEKCKPGEGANHHIQAGVHEEEAKHFNQLAKESAE